MGCPIYVNIPYEWTRNPNPPLVPTDYNPVGSYRTRFEIPETWEGKQVFIHFGAVKSAFYIWVNGKKVGYREDSKTPAEFNITPYIQHGNQPACRAGLPLVRRLLPGMPGLLAHQRHRARCLPRMPGHRSISAIILSMQG